MSKRFALKLVILERTQTYHQLGSLGPIFLKVLDGFNIGFTHNEYD